MKIFLILLLASATHGIDLGCIYTYFTYDGTILQYVPACIVVSMDFSQNSTHVLRANGTPLQLQMTELLFFGWPDYTPCDNFNLDFVPQGITSVFANMKGLIFHNCEITQLNGNELVGYPTLESWVVHYSQIERIPGDLFNETPNMKFVNFLANGINRVGENLLNNLENLTQAWFYYNECIHMGADNSTEIESLIEALAFQCPDEEIETTTGVTTEPTEPPTTLPPRCEIVDMVEFVCIHNEEIEELKLKVDDLQDQINELRETNEELRNIIKKIANGNFENLIKEVQVEEEGNGFDTEAIFYRDQTYKVIPVTKPKGKK